MIKAVFMDYTGTIVQETGKEIQKTVMIICQNSSLHDPETLLKEWWGVIKKLEEASYGDSYLTEDEIADRALQYFVDNFRLRADLEELHRLIQGFWVNAPIFPDVRNFFERCPLPIYVISNNGVQYVDQAMKLNNLLPAGIVCADMVRAYKPHRELFEKALEISGCNSDEVLHVGDSYQSDALGALSAGIKPVLIDRKGINGHSDIISVKDLANVLALLHFRRRGEDFAEDMTNFSK